MSFWPVGRDYNSWTSQDVFMTNILVQHHVIKTWSKTSCATRIWRDNDEPLLSGSRGLLSMTCVEHPRTFQFQKTPPAGHNLISQPHPLLLACFSPRWIAPTYLSELIFLNFHDNILMLGHLLGGKREAPHARGPARARSFEAFCVVRGADEVNPWAFCGSLTKIRGSPYGPARDPHSRPKKRPLSRIFWYEDALHMESDPRYQGRAFDQKFNLFRLRRIWLPWR
jgi:hypothetical protein